MRAALEAGEAGREIAPELVSERTRRFVYEGRLLPPKPSARGEHKTFREEAIDLRLRHGGVLEIRSKIPIRDHHILNMLYVPPAALSPAHVIRDNPAMVDEITAKGNLVAIVTDGSAVLGLGDIGPQAALPVMEGKAVCCKPWPVSRRSRSVSPRATSTRSSASSRTSPRISVASTSRTSARPLLRDRAQAA